VLCLVIVVVLGATYAYFSTRTGKSNNTLVTTGTLQIEYGDGVEIQASNLKPATRGQVLEAYNAGNCIYGEDNTDGITGETICYAKTFTITNTGTLTAYANTTLIDIENTYSENLLYEVFETTPTALTGASLGTNTNLVGLPTNALIPTGSTGKSYTLLIWLSELAGNVDQNQSYKAKLVTKATQTNEVLPNAPEIADGMIPITYNGSTWVKADSTNANNSWYNYNEKKWANVALVSSVSETNTTLSNESECTGEGGLCTREDYMNANTNIEIPEEDILGYFVWIPRYKYQLFNVEFASVSEQEIQVIFESGTETTGIPSETPLNGEWLTHPAFTFGDDELTGLWVAKFETSGTATQPLSKPSQITLVSQNVATQFTTGQKFGTIEYLTSTGVNEVDAHMARNMDWGAIAYLKQSKYGLGNIDIRMNNYNEIMYNTETNAGGSGYITGCGSEEGATATSTPCTKDLNGYQTINGQLASTTGNITGVYDTSGGAVEFVMGTMYEEDNATILYYDSGFSIDIEPILLPTSKYVDMYEYGTTISDQNAYNRSHLGDALGETRGWFGDYKRFIYPNENWFGRGGRPLNGAATGSFAFACYAKYNIASFRTVITINN